MELAIFGLVLTGVLVVICWKNWRAVASTLVAVMLGITIANSGGMLHRPSQDMTDWVQAKIGALGHAGFGGR
jgi:hypothetical protein